MTRFHLTRGIRGAVALLAVPCLSLTGTTTSRAAAPDEEAAVSSGDLVWEAPAECPTRLQVAVRVGPLLAGVPPERRPRIEAHVARAGQRYVLSLQLSTSAGVRRLEAKRCDALLEGVALVLSVALADDEEADAQVSTSQRTPEEDSGVSSPEAGDADASRTDASSSREAGEVHIEDATHVAVGERDRTWLTFTSVVDHGSLPSWSGGIHVAGDRSFSWLRLGIGVTWLPTSAVRLPRSRRAGGDFSLATLDLDGCISTGGDLEARACLVVEGGFLMATGHGLARTQTVVAAWLANGARLAGRLPLGDSWFVEAALGALAVILRPEFAIGGVSDGVVHRPEPFVVRAHFGLSFAF